MNDLNRWEGIGRFGADPELRVLPKSNQPVINAQIACNSSWIDQTTGEKHEGAEWVRIVFYGPIAETVGMFCVKGTQIYVQGRLQTRSWIGSDGFKRYTTEVIVDNPYNMQLLQAAPTKTAVTAKDDAPPLVGNKSEAHMKEQTAASMAIQAPPEVIVDPAVPVKQPEGRPDFDDVVPF